MSYIPPFKRNNNKNVFSNYSRKNNKNIKKQIIKHTPVKKFNKNDYPTLVNTMNQNVVTWDNNLNNIIKSNDINFKEVENIKNKNTISLEEYNKLSDDDKQNYNLLNGEYTKSFFKENGVVLDDYDELYDLIGGVPDYYEDENCDYEDPYYKLPMTEDEQHKYDNMELEYSSSEEEYEEDFDW